MPTVGVGEHVFPVLTKNAEVGTPAENAAQAETTGSFSADALSPSRLQASFFYSREDRARFAGMDEALRMNLSDALADALDKQILTGTAGLLTGTNLANHAVTSVTTYANYRSLFAWMAPMPQASVTFALSWATRLTDMRLACSVLTTRATELRLKI